MMFPGVWQYASTLPETAEKAKALLPSGNADSATDEEKNAVRELVLVDDLSFASAAWYYKTNCGSNSAIVDGLKAETQAGWEAYVSIPSSSLLACSFHRLPVILLNACLPLLLRSARLLGQRPSRSSSRHKAVGAKTFRGSARCLVLICASALPLRLYDITDSFSPRTVTFFTFYLLYCYTVSAMQELYARSCCVCGNRSSRLLYLSRDRTDGHISFV